MNVCMINTDKPGIAKAMLRLWLLNVFGISQHNKITMVASGMENILLATDITSCIIYAKNLVLEYATAFEQHLINVRLGSAVQHWGTVMHRQNVGKKVTFQLRNKILEIRCTMSKILSSLWHLP